jgi:1-aminocyclopropane-1-carboxylate deaminase
MLFSNKNIPNQVFELPIFRQKGIEVFIKREDLLHAEVSGNKFRKLKYNVQQAQKEKCTGMLTFGGAFSNHLAATAAAASACDLPSIGVVRGEELAHKPLNPTLTYCQSKGMQLHFVSRDTYRLKDKGIQPLLDQHPSFYILPEGGTNHLAVEGCSEILKDTDNMFDTIAVAVGTGGTMAGLSRSAKSHQTIAGYQVVSDVAIPKHIRTFVGHNRWTLDPCYKALGYAKTPPELVRFAIETAKQTGVVLDPLYTGPMVWRLVQQLKSNTWTHGNRILIIHTGGHQAIAGINARLEKQGSLLRWPC